MFGIIEKVFVVVMTLFSCYALECVSINNQECKARPEVININSNDPLFYPYSVCINKCSGSCDNINDPHAKLCVPDVVEGINVKVFNVMSKTIETRYIGWHEACRCKCRLDASVCNSRQHWDKGKCKCECKELIDKGRCDKGFIWNPSNCECECDKPCDVREYLDYENCKCKEQLVDRLVKECSENIDENEIIIVTLNDDGNVCGFCTMYIVLFVIAFLIIISISSAFIYLFLLLLKEE